MAKAVFFIKDKVQDVGYRVWIMDKILNSTLNGTAVNTPDGRIKVLLEGNKKEIIRLYKEIKKEKPKLVQNPHLGGLEFDEKFAIPNAMRSSQALQLNQFGKAVTFLAETRTEICTGFEKLGTKIDSLGTGIDSLGNSLGQKIDALPEKIAKALKA